MACLSILTPTYNRAHTLSACYESLLRQTRKDFEWIIVDDGSTDATEELVKSFDTEIFPLVYVRKKNGGKHTALNAAHPHIHGDYVLILDSDDRLTETAVEEVLAAWREYDNDQLVGILTFLKGTAEDQPVCTVADYGTPVEIMRYHRQPVSGTDCCEVIRADLFKRYPFPVYEGENFVSECALWNRVSFTHQCVYINSVIYICEYREDGLTKAGRSMRIRNPHGGMFISELRTDRRNFALQRIKYALLYDCYGFFAKVPPGTMIRNCRSSGLVTLFLPAAFLLYRFWKRKYDVVE